MICGALPLRFEPVFPLPDYHRSMQLKVRFCPLYPYPFPMIKPAGKLKQPPLALERQFVMSLRMVATCGPYRLSLSFLPLRFFIAHPE